MVPVLRPAARARAEGSVGVLVVLMGSLLLLLLACAPESPEAVRPRHVVLISIDTLRADHLGSYGYERPTSPNLDRIAESGAVFLDASTTSPWTLPSHASMLTGLYPNRHGVKDHDKGLSASIPTLGSILAVHGYQTFAVVNSHNLSSRYGLDRGFEHFDYVHEWNDETGPRRRIVNRGESITDRAIAWLQQRDDRPFFMFLHYYDVHSDFAAQAEYQEMFTGPFRGQINGRTRQLSSLRRRNARLPDSAVRHLLGLYDAEIRQLDTTLQRLFDAIRDMGLKDEVLLIVTSDHGEEFMDHGSLLHGRTYHQEIVRVPLLIRGPGVAHGRRVDRPVSLIDIVPTILGLLDLGGDDVDAIGFDGIDVSPHIVSTPRADEVDPQETAHRLLFAEADHGNEKPDMKRMVRRGRFKLLFDLTTRESRIYDLQTDPEERIDIRSRQPKRAAHLEQALFDFMQTENPGEPIDAPDAETLELLEELGYVR